MELQYKDIIDFECPLCKYLLYEPVTTACGHNFCRNCIIRSMDHNNKCPICRAIIHMAPDHSINVLLQTIITKNFPEEHKQRKQELEFEHLDHFNIPLFILDFVLFPGSQLPLHIFEPRYRLMLRRALEGGRKFGVVSVIGTDLAKVGTVTIIENHVKLPDGRSLVTTRGDKKFKILDSWDQDGYKIAKIEYLIDIDEPKFTEGETPSQSDKELKLIEIKEKKTFLMDKIKELIRKFTTDSQAIKDIQEKYGEMPVSDTEAFSYWISSILPITTQQKQNLLEITSTLKRLELANELLIDPPKDAVSCNLHSKNNTWN